MADLTVTEKRVALVYPEEANRATLQKIAAVTVTAGQSLYQNSDGKVALADANAAGAQQVRYVALTGGGAGSSISCVTDGILYGFDLSGMAFDATVFQSDTAGSLADAAGTLSVPVGIVEGVDNNGTIEKVLRFNPRTREAFA